jgi:hypothetical protein
MNRRSATLWRTALAVALAATGLEAATLRIPAGHDMFVTAADGRSYFYLGASSGHPIPQGYFGCVQTASGCLPSDAIVAPVRVTFQGLATGDFGLEPGALESQPCEDVYTDDKFGRHCADGVGHFTDPFPPPLADQVDTIVLRNADLVLGNIGSVGTIPIELVAVSLRSVTPMEVRYGNGRVSQRFHVKAAGPRVKGRLGTMTLTRSGVSSGTYFSTLPLAVEISFQNTSSTGPSAGPPIVLDVDLRGAELPWKYHG